MQTFNFYHELIYWMDENAWILQVFMVIFLSLLTDLLLRMLLKRAHIKLKRTPNPWDDMLASAMQGPATVLIWAIGITFAADVVQVEMQATIFTAVEPIRQICVIGALSWFLIRLIGRFQQTLLTRTKNKETDIDATTVEVVGKLLRASIIITAGLVVLQTLGFSISGVLAFGGIGGLAIGFAARDLLANFFGGLILHLDRPFSVGDWVRSPDREIEGTVEYIGWRLTRIRSFDTRPIYIPNGLFSTMVLVNPSRMSHRQIYETIGIRYQDAGKMPHIVADIEAMLTKHPEIDQDEIMMVNFNSFAPSSLDFFIYVYTRTTQWVKFHKVKQDILLEVNKIIALHNAEVAFPTSTIYLPKPVQVVQSGESSI